jgi:hypothetical protein
MATATKTAPKKSAAKQEGLVGYCMKTKQKEPIQDVTIEEKGGRFIAKGVTAEGYKVTVIMSAEQAQAALDNEWATLVEEAAPAKTSKKK